MIRFITDLTVVDWQYINVFFSPSKPKLQKHDRLCNLLLVIVRVGILFLLAAPVVQELSCLVVPWLKCLGMPVVFDHFQL